jgi:hypothetical protein
VSRTGSAGRILARSLAVAVVASGALVLRMTAAHADGQICYAEQTDGASGGVSYHVHCRERNGGGGGGAGGGGGGGAPEADTCKLAEQRAADAANPRGAPLARWCDDEHPETQCWLFDQVFPEDVGADSIAKVKDVKPPASAGEVFCANLHFADPGGATVVINNVQSPRQLIDRANDAYGNLRPPPAKVTTSPGSPSVVQLDTWYWLDDNTFGPAPITGTSADGMVAIATRTTSDWTPGDGAGTIECQGAGVQYAAGRTSDCTHVYTKSSSGGPMSDAKGNAAYRGTVVRNYTVRYEFFGVPVIVPGARLTFSSNPDAFPISVAEVQTANSSNFAR